MGCHQDRRSLTTKTRDCDRKSFRAIKKLIDYIFLLLFNIFFVFSFWLFLIFSHLGLNYCHGRRWFCCFIILVVLIKTEWIYSDNAKSCTIQELFFILAYKKFDWWRLFVSPLMKFYIYLFLNYFDSYEKY